MANQPNQQVNSIPQVNAIPQAVLLQEALEALLAQDLGTRLLCQAISTSKEDIRESILDCFNMHEIIFKPRIDFNHKSLIDVLKLALNIPLNKDNFKILQEGSDKKRALNKQIFS